VTDDDGERYVSVTRCGAELLLGGLADGRVRVWEAGHLQPGAAVAPAAQPAALVRRAAETSLLAEVMDELVSGDHDRVRLGVGRIPSAERAAYVAALTARLLGESAVERRSSLTALFLMKAPALAAALIQAASDPEASVRREAMFLIGRARVRQALEVVNQRLSDGNGDVRAAAREAYQKLTGRRA
jgi:HEAT repeat protein